MACSIQHLEKVALDGFTLIDEHYGRQARKVARRDAPPPQRNQYVYHGPQAVTIVQHSNTGNYHQIQTNKSYETWYVCQVSQAPIAAGDASISSNDAAAFYGGVLHNDNNGKTKQK